MADSIDKALKTIVNGVISAGEVTVAADIASAVIKAEAEIVRLWTLHRITLVAMAELAKQPKSPSPYQQLLPGFSGLEEKLSVRDGRIVLGEATITALKQNIAALRAAQKGKTRKAKEKVDALIKERQSLISDMKRYKTPGVPLTVQRYCEMKAAGVPKKRTREKRVGA